MGTRTGSNRGEGQPVHVHRRWLGVKWAKRLTRDCNRGSPREYGSGVQARAASGQRKRGDERLREILRTEQVTAHIFSSTRDFQESKGQVGRAVENLTRGVIPPPLPGCPPGEAVSLPGKDKHRGPGGKLSLSFLGLTKKDLMGKHPNPESLTRDLATCWHHGNRGGSS